MKIDFKKILLSILLPIISITTTGCVNDANKVTIINDLDLYIKSNEVDNGNSEIFKPKNIVGDEFIKKIEDKEDFILYFYSNYCTACETVSNYLDVFLKNYNYLIYSFSNESSDIYYIKDTFSNLFNETPKIMFFNDGELSLTLSSSRYSSYRLFESSMIEFCLRSNIYTASNITSINTFIDKYDEFILFILDDKNSSYAEPSSNYIFNTQIKPLLEESEIPSLLLDLKYIDDETKNNIYTAYGLPYTETALACHVETINNKVSSKYFNYANKDELDELIDVIKN